MTDRFEDIVLTRRRGRGVTVDTAPRHARMVLELLTQGAYLRVTGGDVVEIADQVAYRVTGWDPQARALLLELAEDWRTPGLLVTQDPLSEAQYVALQADWRREYGDGQTAHRVELVNGEETS